MKLQALQRPARVWWRGPGRLRALQLLLRMQLAIRGWPLQRPLLALLQWGLRRLLHGSRRRSSERETAAAMVSAAASLLPPTQSRQGPQPENHNLRRRVTGARQHHLNPSRLRIPPRPSQALRREPPLSSRGHQLRNQPTTWCQRGVPLHTNPPRKCSAASLSSVVLLAHPSLLPPPPVAAATSLLCRPVSPPTLTVAPSRTRSTSCTLGRASRAPRVSPRGRRPTAWRRSSARPRRRSAFCSGNTT